METLETSSVCLDTSVLIDNLRDKKNPNQDSVGVWAQKEISIHSPTLGSLEPDARSHYSFGERHNRG